MNAEILSHAINDCIYNTCCDKAKELGSLLQRIENIYITDNGIVCAFYTYANPSKCEHVEFPWNTLHV